MDMAAPPPFCWRVGGFCVALGNRVLQLKKINRRTIATKQGNTFCGMDYPSVLRILKNSFSFFIFLLSWFWDYFAQRRYERISFSLLASFKPSRWAGWSRLCNAGKWVHVFHRPLVPPLRGFARHKVHRGNIFSFLLSPAEKECLQRDKRAEKKMIYVLVIRKNHSKAITSIYSNKIVMLPKKVNSVFFAVNSIERDPFRVKFQATLFRGGSWLFASWPHVQDAFGGFHKRKPPPGLQGR